MSCRLSVVVVVHNMQREAPRTLHSLTAGYQQGVSEDDYEVIVVENASTERLSDETVRGFARNVRYIYHDTTSKSPAAAVNVGIANTRGDIVGIMVDGARMLTPGVLKYALAAGRMFETPVTAIHGWHLGPHTTSPRRKHFTKAAEDAALRGIEWPRNGYRLFEVSSPAGSNRHGYFGPVAESNCLFLRRDTVSRLGGFDERFQTVGGGLVNLDLFRRACELPGTQLVVVLGEGSFHQMHGGVSSNASAEAQLEKWAVFEREYSEIRGIPYAVPSVPVEYIGHCPPEGMAYVRQSAAMTDPERRQDGGLSRVFTENMAAVKRRLKRLTTS